MPKDTKGHGSNSRGGSVFRGRPSGPVIIGTSTTHYPDNGQTFHRVHYSNGSTTESPTMGTHMQALFDRARSQGAPHETSGLMDGMKNKLSGDIAAGRMIASEPKSGSSYYGRALSKTGRAIGETGPHENHETAASATFAAHPNAKSVSTARGYGFDIRFHNRT